MKIFITVIQTSLINSKQSGALIKLGQGAVILWNTLFPCKNNRRWVEDKIWYGN